MDSAIWLCLGILLGGASSLMSLFFLRPLVKPGVGRALTTVFMLFALALVITGAVGLGALFSNPHPYQQLSP